ncbi:MAG: aldo/keto reductase [Pyrinomonadaceae bacterium]|nr:aldo/keto reductase [Pyrinomonadaceae bacterium]
MNRRDFITKATIAAGLTATVGSFKQISAAENENNMTNENPIQPKDGEMIYRTLGKTGEKVSAIGLGGFHIGKIKDEAESIKLMHNAINRGLTFMDNCWDYNEGVSEIRMGKALKNGYRNKVFLMTKIDGRDKKTAARQIDESLARLQTDSVDLLQYHEIIRFEDPDRIFAEGGAAEAFLDAKKAGKCRFIGFTGHKDPLIHLRMLEIAATNGIKFDAVQMPLNVMDAHFRSFEKQVLPKLVTENIGVLGMKSMGDPFILNSKTVTPIECLHYALNLPTSVVITGIDKMEILEQAFQAVSTFKPMSSAEVNSILMKTASAAKTGKFEKFKTDVKFDGTAKNPRWLGDIEA